MSAAGATPESGHTTSGAGARIALDAMGGDNAPAQIVEGAVRAARELGMPITLVGPEPVVRAELAKHPTSGLDLTIVHADEVIGMDEHPAEAVRAKRRNTMTIALEQVRDGRAIAAVSAGNSGAMLAASLFTLRRIPGIDRPALGGVFPAAGGRRTLVADIGANTDSRPAYLVQFALMGSIYMEKVFGVANPRVGLLANGEEETKGDQLVQEAHKLLKAAAGPAGLNFIGNVEGRDVFKGTCDVVVTDGFTGNVVLKTAESVVSLLVHKVRQEVASDPLAKLGALFMSPALRRLQKQIDWEEHGAAPLLGVDGVCFVGHGASSARAIRSAIRTLARFVEERVNEHIREEIQADHDSAA